ncbi:MAG: hypothetical protein WA843_02665 [Candidatus Saccharimonadales bacterium]
MRWYVLPVIVIGVSHVITGLKIAVKDRTNYDPDNSVIQSLVSFLVTTLFYWPIVAWDQAHQK